MVPNGQKALKSQQFFNPEMLGLSDQDLKLEAPFTTIIAGHDTDSLLPVTQLASVKVIWFARFGHVAQWIHFGLPHRFGTERDTRRGLPLLCKSCLTQAAWRSVSITTDSRSLCLSQGVARSVLTKYIIDQTYCSLKCAEVV